MKAAYDVVVVGSGFGGAITGCRLAQAGRSLCILERGKRWGKTEFPRSTGEVAKSFWVQNESLGFLEYNAFRRIDVIRGSGVGGGSLHYFNVHLRAAERLRLFGRLHAGLRSARQEHPGPQLPSSG